MHEKEWRTYGIRLVVNTIAGVILGTAFAVLISTMKKGVRNKMGNIDFSKSDIYFQWTRWDYTIIVAAVYTFLCIN